MTDAGHKKAYDVMAPTCPSRVVLNRIGARWTIFVVVALEHQTMRFGELKSRIRGITSKSLTETLRALEHDGLVCRKVGDTVPPSVEYSLTPLGRSLLVPLAAVREWAEEHVTEVLEANATPSVETWTETGGAGAGAKNPVR